jgi:hypothetical protein
MRSASYQYHVVFAWTVTELDVSDGEADYDSRAGAAVVVFRRYLFHTNSACAA